MSLPADGVVLTKDGATAYVWDTSQAAGNIPRGLSVVNTQTLSATATLSSVGAVNDVVLSPDDSMLYVSVGCGSAVNCNSASGACPIGRGICAFDRSTLELKWTVPFLFGLMSLSSDGTSLYVSYRPGDCCPALYVVNTSTQAVSNIPLPDAGPEISRVTVDPVGPYALVLVNNNYDQDPQTAFLINTATNKIVQKFFSSAPGNGTLAFRNGVAFAPDGNSVWMLLTCMLPQKCSLPSGISLAGISFPSGSLIGETDSLDMHAANLAFPR